MHKAELSKCIARKETLLLHFDHHEFHSAFTQGRPSANLTHGTRSIVILQASHHQSVDESTLAAPIFKCRPRGDVTGP